MKSKTKKLKNKAKNPEAVSVWWDFENCNIPIGLKNADQVAIRIQGAVRAKGITGPVSIFAYGNVLQLAPKKHQALTLSGNRFQDVPHASKNSADKAIIKAILRWISKHPPPAHVFLIAGDADFACILHFLRLGGYSILLACPENTPSSLRKAANIIRRWNSLVKRGSSVRKTLRSILTKVEKRIRKISEHLSQGSLHSSISQEISSILALEKRNGL